MKSGWSRLAWCLLVLPIWLTFMEMDMFTPFLSMAGYLLFGFAVWLWFRFMEGGKKEEKDR